MSPEQAKARKVVKRWLIVAVLLAFVLLLPLIVSAPIQPPIDQPWVVKEPASPRERMIAHGSLAPSPWNLQPWKVRLDPKDKTKFRLYVDETRLAPVTDPVARQTMFALGTFIAFAMHDEHYGGVTSCRLMPEGEVEPNGIPELLRDKPIAELWHVDQGDITEEWYCSAPYDFGPLTYSGPFTVTETDLLGGAEGLTNGITRVLPVRDNSQRKVIQRILYKTWQEFSQDIEVKTFARSMFRANGQSLRQLRDGYSLRDIRLASEPSNGRALIGTLYEEGLMTLLPALADKYLAAKPPTPPSHEPPLYAVIITKSDSRTAQVEAGFYFGQILIRTSPHSRAHQGPIDVSPNVSAERLKLHRMFAKEGETIQCIVEIGELDHKPQIPIRRPVSSYVVP